VTRAPFLLGEAGFEPTTSASRREIERPTMTGLDLLRLVAGPGDRRRSGLTGGDRAMDARSAHSGSSDLTGVMMVSTSYLGRPPTWDVSTPEALG